MFRNLGETAAVLTLAGAAACGPADTGFTSGTSARGIYGGNVVDFTTSPATHASVVGLHEVVERGVYRTPFCSGTLIDAAKTIVLTAAHCLVRGERTLAPAGVRVYAATDSNTRDDAPNVLFGKLHEVAEVRVHPEYDQRAIRNDIALIRLREPITDPAVTSTPPLPPELGLTPADVAAALPLDFAGWGRADDDSGTGILRHAESALGALGCGDVPGCVGADSATQLAYAQDQATTGLGPCNGDSGGPAFVSRDVDGDGAPDTDFVAGITSYGESSCARWGVSTRADAFDAFISSF